MFMYESVFNFVIFFLLFSPLGIPIAFSFLIQSEARKKPRTINDKPHFRKIIRIIKAGKVKELNKEYDDAEELYHKALEALYKLMMAKTPSDLEFSQTKSYIFDCMANLSFLRNDFAKSEKLFKEVLRELIVQQKIDTDDNAIIEISLKLAMIYAAQRRYEDAKVGYKFCLDTMEKKLHKLEDYMAQADQDSLALYGIISEAYSKFLKLQKMWIESLPYLQKSFSIACKVYEEAHPQVAVISNDLGMTFSILNDQEEALKHFEFAANIGKQCNSPDLPIILYNLGDLLKKMNDTERALETFKLALDYCNEKTPEDVHKSILLALDPESSFINAKSNGGATKV